MSALTPVPDDDIDARYYLTGSKPIQFLLSGLAVQRAQFLVQFNLEHSFLTSLIAVQAEENRLIFDCSGSTQVNEALQEASRCSLVGRPDGITVQFSCGPVRQINYSGIRAFATKLPEKILRLQRREFFRIEITRTQALYLHAKLPQGEAVKWLIHDLSVAGVGIQTDQLPPELSIGLVLPGAFFNIPEEKQPFVTELTVRNILERPSGRSGKPSWRIGFAFKPLSFSEESRIQRYIAKIERDKRDLL